MNILYPPPPPLPPLLPHVPPSTCGLSLIFFVHANAGRIFRPAPMLVLPHRQPPNDSSHHVRHPASHIMLIVTYLFCSCQRQANLPPCPPAGVTLPSMSQQLFQSHEKLPQRTLLVVDNKASEDRHSRSRSTCSWTDRSRRSRCLSPFTSCGIVLILLLVVNAGVVSSLPRLAPFSALIIDRGGGKDRVSRRRTTMPAPVAPSPLPVKARRSLLTVLDSGKCEDCLQRS